MTNNKGGIEMVKRWVQIGGRDFVEVTFVSANGQPITSATAIVAQADVEAHAARVAAAHGTIAKVTWAK